LDPEIVREVEEFRRRLESNNKTSPRQTFDSFSKLRQICVDKIYNRKQNHIQQIHEDSDQSDARPSDQSPLSSSPPEYRGNELESYADVLDLQHTSVADRDRNQKKNKAKKK